MIKTLIVPIFIALPNPDSGISDQINKTLYDILWNKKAKIKKTIVVKQYAEGELKRTSMLKGESAVGPTAAMWAVAE